jgi:hypothetical protein
MGFFKTDQEKRIKAFRKAIGRNDIDGIKQGLADGLAINGMFPSRDETPLFRAVVTRATESVKYLLEAGADANFAQKDGISCLIRAAGDGSAEIVPLLLAHGAKLDARVRDSEWTALHAAASNGRGSIVKMLLEAGMDAGAMDKNLRTAADVANAGESSVKRAIERLIRDWKPAAPASDQGKAAKALPAATPADEAAADAPPSSPAEPEKPADGWRLTGDNEVTQVSTKADIGYRLTEIFNFRSATYSRIAHNLATGQDSHTLRFFDEFGNPGAIDRARAALQHLGGKDPSENKLDKPAVLSPRSAPGL